MSGRSLLLAGALLAAATPAAAQVDSAGRPVSDTTARRDTTPPRDTAPAYLPAFPAPIPPGPLPLGTRYSFPLDSLVVFTNAATLSDLLLHVPGVYVARGGMYGAPEIVFYGGRGAQGLEVYWDGVPYLPLGRDPAFLDPARISLAMLERVDVVVTPATLRVYLVTMRPRSTVASSEVRVQTGDYSIADYRGGFRKRWRDGMGLSIGADWNAIDGIPSSSTTAFTSVDLWLKAEYVPSPRAGVSYQILSSTWDRAALAGAVDRWKVTRQDRLLRFFFAPGPDAPGLGPRLEASFGGTTTARDTATVDRTMNTARVAVSDAWRTAAVSFAATLGGPGRRSTLEAQGAWLPLPFLSVAADARRSAYTLGRSGRRVHAAAGLRLPLGFSARGEAAWGEDLDAPALPGDTAQTAADVAGAVRWDTRFASLEVGRVRRDPFAPLGFPAGLVGRRGLNALSPTPQSDYLSVSGALRPLPGLTLSGWYCDPVTGGGDFEPPHHGRVSVTFLSKFWRHFRSGAFTLRGEYALESWSRGLAGRDTTSGGTPQPLAGASFSEFNFQIQIVGVTAFWVQRNSKFFRGQYTPGLDYPRRAQFFGVRWLFTN